MRVYFVIVGFIACALASGCSRSGDFSAFVVSEVTKHGGHTVSNAPLPVVQARWSIKSDENGFQARVKSAPFSNIDAVMHQAFGTPKVSIAAKADGQPHRVWAALDIGVAIQLIGRPDGADIICVRGMRDLGEMFESMEKKK